MSQVNGRSTKGMSDRYGHIIVDGSNLARRSFHKHRGLSIEHRGRTVRTGVTFGFLKSLIKLKRLFRGELLITWDQGYDVRKKLYPQYKEKRRVNKDEAEMTDYYDQLETLSKVLAAIGVSQYRCKGWEADDLMHTLSVMHTSSGRGRAIIASNDHDMYQCLTESIHQFVDLKGRTRVWTPKVFEDEYELPPSRYLDVLSLSGDSGDGVPGIKGVGELTAMRAIRACPTLVHDIIASNQLNPSGALTASLIAKLDRDTVVLTRQLVMLYTVRKLQVISPPQNRKLMMRCLEILELDSFTEEHQWNSLCQLGM